MSAGVAVMPTPLPGFAASLGERLERAGCVLAGTPGVGSRVGLLVVSVEPGLDRAETADRVFDLVERLRECRDATGTLPRRVVALLHPKTGNHASGRPDVSAGTSDLETSRHPGDAAEASDDLHQLAAGLLRTLLIYLTAHTALDDTRINGVDVPSSDPELERMGLDLIVALASGMLDGVRGQLLRPAVL